MNNREADRRPSVDNPNTIDDEKEVEVQIEKSDSPSSSSYARSDDINISSNAQISSDVIGEKLAGELRTIACPSCGHHIPINHQGGIWNDLPGMPAGVKFDPTDVQIMEHLEAKMQSNYGKLHPLVDEYIQTLEGENGICYTHPEKLPGLSKDGLIRHYFHRPSKAYTTGTRKRRKVSVDEDVDGSGSSTGSETRWHKTGKTRAVVVNGTVKGFKKILVLYTNYGRQKKPEKTNWVMHQYHLGDSEEEKEGELVLSKVFYQTHPRNSLLPQQPQPISFNEPLIQYPHQHQEQQQQKQLMLQQVGSSTSVVMQNSSDINLEYYQPRFMSFGHRDQCVVGGRESNFQFIPNLEVRNDHDGPSSAGVDGRNKQKEQFEGDVRPSN